MNFILLLVVVIGAFLLARWILTHAPARGKSFLLSFGAVLLLVLLLAMVFTGRLHWLFGLFATILPFIRRLAPLLLPLLRLLPSLRTASSSSKRAAGQQSTVSSLYLAMTLDHDSGIISGVVRKGPLEGAELEQIDSRQLRDLYKLCQQEDPEGLRLLEPYLRQRFGDTWFNTTDDETKAQAGTSAMTVAEAYAILDLEPGADRDSIILAHKRIMARLHPDRGGSNYLAAKVNEAKELLLEKVA